MGSHDCRYRRGGNGQVAPRRRVERVGRRAGAAGPSLLAWPIPSWGEPSDRGRILEGVEQAESLGWLLDHDSRDNVMVALDDPVAIDGLAKITGRELDDALHQAVHAAHAVGELKSYGGIRLWTGVRLTAKALRDLGQAQA